MTRTDDIAIVLVHGAFAESSSWNGVIERLHADGERVLAAANPLRGVQSDTDYLTSVLQGLPGGIVLVGHSYGGMLITNAAARHDRVLGLVYVAGFAPDWNESAADLAARFPGSTLGETLINFPLPEGGYDLYIAPDRFHDQFCADVPAEQAALMAATQRPATDSALNDSSGEPGWASTPSWFIFGDGDNNIPVAGHRFMADRADAKTIEEIAGASHAVGVSQPDAVVAVIRQAMRTARGTQSPTV